MTILDCSFDDPTCGGQLGDIYGTVGNTVHVVSDPDAPLSGPNVLSSNLYYPNKNGGTQLDYMAPSDLTNVFVGFWWKPSAPFGGNIPGGNKTFFVRDGFSSNGVFYWLYRSTDTLESNGDLGRYMWDTQTSGTNADICAQGGRKCFANTGNEVLIEPGNWYKIEVRFVGGSCATCPDSQLHMWINDSKVMEYTTMQYATTFRNAWTWSETWDGFGNGTVPEGYTSDQSHYLDHLHVSTVP